MPVPPRCEVVPWHDQQALFLVDGVERTRWHFGRQYKGPFLHPLRGPSGAPLTRMGHPGAPNHDHHRSIWFAHNKVTGVDFWGDAGTDFIAQRSWLAYEDGDDEALMAVSLTWHDGHDPAELLEQELIVSVRPAPGSPRETLVELQTRFLPRAEMLEFGQTNFGFLAIRVARGISAHFGGGRLSNDRGEVGEPALFAKRSRWMDYSGTVRPPVPETSPADSPPPTPVDEGITCFDHPDNPSHPTCWHVRDDGWMGASACLEAPLLTTREHPLTLRYLLHAHGGAADLARAGQVFDLFAAAPGLEVVSGQGVPHRHSIVRRRASH